MLSGLLKGFPGLQKVYRLTAGILPGVVVLMFALLAPADLVAGSEAADLGRYVEYEFEFDPYYSSLGVYVSLTDKPIPDAGEKSELEVYRVLLLSSYIPRFLVLETSVNPLPVLGVAIKSSSPDFYESVDVSRNFNLVQAVTAGFEEPYAFSLFLGNVVNFASRGEKKSGNKGYMGYLFSIGNYHIGENEFVRDNWYELEWKIKGDRKEPERSTHWSFRVGLKNHGNDEIADAVYLSLRRSRLDYTASAASVLKNSGFEYTFDMDLRTFNALRHYFFVSKKWPFKSMKFALTVDAGFIWASKLKYSGSLGEDSSGDNFQIILWPNIEF